MRSYHRRRQGAVLVEGIITLSGIGLCLVLMGGLHAAAVADLNALDRAREQAWSNALAGCPGDGFDVQDIVTGLRDGELPLPNALVPSREAEGVGQKPSGNNRVVRIPCASAPTNSGPNESGQWVADLFPQ